MLFAAASVVSVSYAVTPKEAVHFPKQQYQFGEMSRQFSDFDVVKKSGVQLMKKSAIRKAEEQDPMKVKYAIPEGTMSIGMSQSGSYALHTYRLNPAYTPVTFTNLSTGAKEFEWEYWGQNYEYDMETGEVVDADYQYSDTEDLTISYNGLARVQAPTLYAVGEDGSDDSYSANYPYTDYKFGGSNTLMFSDGKGGSYAEEMGVMTDLNTLRLMVQDNENGVPQENATAYMYYWPNLGYDPSDEDADPETGIETQLLDYIYDEVLGEENHTSTIKFAGFGAKFPQPAANYSISQLWMRFYYQSKKNTVVECKLYRLDEDGYPTGDVVASGSTTVKRVLEPTGGTLVFDLSSVDEDGLETDDPIVIDFPCIAMLEFNIDDFKMLTPIAGNYDTADRADEPTRNNTILVYANDELVSFDMPWIWTFQDGSGYMFVNNWCCMIDASYNFFVEESGSLEKTVPVEGGEVVFNIDCNYNLAYFFQENMVYTNAPDDIIITDLVNDEDTGYQVMTVEVTPLPEGEIGRDIYIEFDEALMSGCPNYLTIHQGESGVNVITTSGDVKYFDLAGRQVANPEKGLYIKVEGNKAQKVIL